MNAFSIRKKIGYLFALDCKQLFTILKRLIFYNLCLIVKEWNRMNTSAPDLCWRC